MVPEIRSSEQHPPCPPQGGNHSAAVAWGQYVAACVREHCGNDLQKIISTWQWRLLIVEEDESDFPLPRFAVWEGDTNTIRLFRAPLARAFPNQPQALALACAHEMFHGLVAHAYQNLLPRHDSPPPLTKADEEIAAHAFAHALVANFRLTFETSLPNLTA